MLPRTRPGSSGVAHSEIARGRSASTLRRASMVDQSSSPGWLNATAPSTPRRKLVGSIFTPHAAVALESRSSSKGKRRPSSSAMSCAVRALPPICTARMTRVCLRALRAAARWSATGRGKAHPRWPRNSTRPPSPGSRRDGASRRWRRPVPAAAPPPPGARQRAAPSDLARRDRVLEVVGIELIQPLSARLAVRIHEERQLGAGRIGQLDVVARIESEPVHLPRAEEALARCLYLGIFETELSGRFLEDDLAHVSRIDRNPTDALGEEFRAAVLRLADDRRRGTQTLVAERGARDADAVDIARRDAQGSGEADEEAVEIGAFAAEVAALQHRLDVAGTASAGLGVAQRVLNDPFIDCAPLLQIGAGPLRHADQRRLAYQAVARDRLRRRGVERDFGAAERLRARSRDGDRAIAGAELALQLDKGRLGSRGPLGVEHRHAVLADAHLLHPLRVAVPGVAESALPVGIGIERHRQPGARNALRPGDLRAGGHFECAPAGRRAQAAPGKRCNDGSTEQFTSFHGGRLADGGWGCKAAALVPLAPDDSPGGAPIAAPRWWLRRQRPRPRG